MNQLLRSEYWSYKKRPMYMKAEVSDMDILHLSQVFIISTFIDPSIDCLILCCHSFL
jgi:hypothetical protein